MQIEENKDLFHVIPIDLEGYPNTDFLRTLFNSYPDIGYKFNQAVSSLVLDIGRAFLVKDKINIIFLPYKRYENDACDFRLINAAILGLNDLVIKNRINNIRLKKFCMNTSISSDTLIRNIKERIDKKVKLVIVDEL